MTEGSEDSGPVPKRGGGVAAKEGCVENKKASKTVGLDRCL